MKKKSKIKVEKDPRELYVEVSYHESEGSNYDAGDGTRFSGFQHAIINIDKIGPCYFAEKGRGYKSHRLSECYYRYDCIQAKNNKPTFKFKEDKIPHAPEEKDIPKGKDKLFFVVVRYGDGGTFGRTDGFFEFPFVGLSYDEAGEWINKYGDRLEQAHNGYFESFQGCSIESITFCDEKNVPENKWFD